MAPQVSVICTAAPAVEQAHIPGRMFFADPLPDNFITVPTCKACNAGVKHDEEYLRADLKILTLAQRSDEQEELIHREAGLRRYATV